MTIKHLTWTNLAADENNKAAMTCHRCGEMKAIRVPCSIPHLQDQIRVFNENHASCEEV